MWPETGLNEFYLSSIALGCVMTVASILLLHHIAVLIWNEKKAFFVGLMTWFCMPLWLWAMYAYTDIAGMFLLVVMLYCYIKAVLSEFGWKACGWLCLFGVITMDDNMRNAWLDMISKVYTNLHNSDRVLRASNVSDKKRERLLKYFERLEELHNKVSKTKSVNGEKLLKNFYYDLYVIKPENIPDAYFQNQVRLARERGYGNIELTEEDKRRMTEEVIDDQKKSLDKWIEYFLYDEESKSYEMWEKYWVFQGLQNLGKYDKETSKFSKRDKSTVYPFPPVEREYIFTTLKLMEDFLKDKKGEEDIKQALSTGNFKLLYEYVIKQSFLKGEHQSNSTDGKWIKYEQGSDYNILRDSLQGYYTGWCTAAGENFAKDQLAGGDFYVYYSLDENGEAKVPRIAIRMDGKDKIGEIRGIADNQNMEPEMMSILEEKLKEFPDRDKYLKKENDMKLLTLIDKKVNNNIELNLGELKFLYEIDDKISVFGFMEDPRIKEIKSKRNIIYSLRRICIRRIKTRTNCFNRYRCNSYSNYDR